MGSSLVVVEPEHIRRLKGIISSLRMIIEANSDGSGMSKMAFLISTFADEMADELAEMPEPAVRLIMFQIGEMIAWIGHGDNTRLPEGVREFAEQIQPSGKHAASDGFAGTYRELDSQSG